VNPSDAIETPSGKGAGDENFPVGSWLLPARLRPHVAIFYRFARAIDDIADNPDLSPDDKIERLSRFEAAVTGTETGDPALATAHRMQESLTATDVTAQHCLDLIAAFKQDAIKSRYDDWSDLLGYCKFSANPVGRYLLDLHGEAASGYPFSDALCSALQVLNHLQDCQDDYLTMDRVYLPLAWLKSAGVDERVLKRDFSTPGLRRVLNLSLDEVDDLLVMARLLPERLSSRALAMESAVILRLARKLSAMLRERDPLAARVALGRLDFVSCGVRGIGSVLRVRPRSRSRPVKAARQGR
jgi:hydroxysqualene synthase